jgi:hypothetical protein
MRRALTFDRVHLIRAAGKSDGHWASFWLMTVAAIRDARTGRTWASHPTPPDTKPRGPGRPFKRLHVAGADLIARMPAPDQSDNGEAKP